jgi:hypothetical protein
MMTFTSSELRRERKMLALPFSKSPFIYDQEMVAEPLEVNFDTVIYSPVAFF